MANIDWLKLAVTISWSMYNAEPLIIYFSANGAVAFAFDAINWQLTRIAEFLAMSISSQTKRKAVMAVSPKIDSCTFV